jgi:isoleucyl-tRNA synthetase
VTGLCQILAPTLAFTADEAWEFVPGKPTGSVHEANWAEKQSDQLYDFASWDNLLGEREAILQQLEKARQEKIIGKALDAKVKIVGHNKLIKEFCKAPEDFRELLNVSQLEVEEHSEESILVRVLHADGQKCERCWHWETDIGQNAEHPTICGRCIEAVKQLSVPKT